MEFKREKASQARYLSIVTTVSYLAIHFSNDTLLVGAISSMSGLILTVVLVNKSFCHGL